MDKDTLNDKILSVRNKILKMQFAITKELDKVDRRSNNNTYTANDRRSLKDLNEKLGKAYACLKNIRDDHHGASSRRYFEDLQQSVAELRSLNLGNYNETNVNPLKFLASPVEALVSGLAYLLSAVASFGGLAPNSISQASYSVAESVGTMAKRHFFGSQTFHSQFYTSGRESMSTDDLEDIAASEYAVSYRR